MNYYLPPSLNDINYQPSFIDNLPFPPSPYIIIIVVIIFVIIVVVIIILKYCGLNPELSHIWAHFIFLILRQDLPKLPRLVLDLQSSWLSLSRSWNCGHAPQYLAPCIILKQIQDVGLFYP